MTSTQTQGRPRLHWPAFVAANLSFYLLATLGTLIYFPSVVILLTLIHYTLRRPRLTRYLVRRAISYWGAIVVRCGWPFVRVRYVDQAPDQRPPFVVVANHRSSSDGFMFAFLPFECVEILNIWPTRLPLVKWLVRVSGYLRIREMPFEEFLRLGGELLQSGCSVAAFPEGTRSGSRQVGPFHGAAFRLAQENKIPLVPMAIAGNEQIPPRGSIFLRPGTITLTKLPAISPEEFANLTPFQFKNLARERIVSRLDAVELRGEA